LKTDKISSLRTEGRNAASAHLDLRSPLEIARIINREDEKIAGAVRRALPVISRAIEAIAKALLHGGRLIYVGAGTSGRIAALDAAECPPTFGLSPRLVQYVIAGGKEALGRAAEYDEDSRRAGVHDIRRRHLTRADVVVGLAASGRTPYTVAAVEYARRHGVMTVAVTSSPGSPLARAARIPIVVGTGPEVVAGSTRMKAGTAQKMVLNMLTTGAMARLGYVYGNQMVNVHTGNRKLLERGLGILQRCEGCERKQALRMLRRSRGSVSVALVALKASIMPETARELLKQTHGNVRAALQNASRRSRKRR